MMHCTRIISRFVLPIAAWAIFSAQAVEAAEGTARKTAAPKDRKSAAAAPAAKAPFTLTDPNVIQRQETYKQVGEVTLKIDIFEPKQKDSAKKYPAIVFFFGGGWVGGSPGQFYRQCEYLAGRGMIAMSAEYRVKSRHQTTPAECVKDGKSAVRWIRANAARLDIDPDRIAAGGGSAGGHVAAAVATSPQPSEL
jgi:acetyl esterase/lipase